MVLPDIDLRLRELLRRSGREVAHGALQVLLAVDQAVAPDDAQPVVALLVAILGAALEPHLRHHRILLHTLATQVHPPEVPRRRRGITD